MNGHAPNLQPGLDDYRQFTSILLRINAHLDRLDERMNAAEARATTNEQRVAAHLDRLDERMAAAEARATANEQRTAALHIRIMAMANNLDRRAQNAACCQFFKSPLTALAPLVDLRTGHEILGFPTTLAELSQLDEATARSILDALEVRHEERDWAGVIELLRYHAYYKYA
ncbi:hypothetical protein TsFJ059_006987 [Trichoderma semiorbis]|uniref:Uncharacterized protein n=1 Tax=Trichoderma semiorbis TaxID=1491008 RepID=A0A9P8KPW4_9HYPO|nr:hypothetical protein TsFJ059_006987 [Trichoderma semiorbis]